VYLSGKHLNGLTTGLRCSARTGAILSKLLEGRGPQHHARSIMSPRRIVPSTKTAPYSAFEDYSDNSMSQARARTSHGRLAQVFPESLNRSSAIAEQFAAHQLREPSLVLCYPSCKRACLSLNINSLPVRQSVGVLCEYIHEIAH
jgi:hypothetical protein